MKNRSAIIITGAGFVIGLAEALIYYNMGQNTGKKFSYKIPPGQELLKTAVVVLVTSILTAALSKSLELVMKPDEKEINEV